MEQIEWNDGTHAYMRGTVEISSQEMVDKLVYGRDIRKPQVEEVFRKINRANYLSTRVIEALKQFNLPWSSGTKDLSGPDIYAKALEALDIQPGDSFLNVGSGTGYLSTMAGLLIKSGGVNHGVEESEDNVAYAREKLKQFQESSVWYDPLYFCEPKFFTGNIYHLTEADKFNTFYDKIYVGAECMLWQEMPENGMQNQLSKLLNVGGTIVLQETIDQEKMKLVSITRTSTLEFSERHSVVELEILYADRPRLVLISAEKPLPTISELPPKVPPTLKDYCKKVILRALARSRYSSINSLPISIKDKKDLKGGREWDTPCPTLKKLC